MTTRHDDYNTGFEHGRHNNAMWGSSAEYRHGYYQGQQERRYWDERSAFDEESDNDSGAPTQPHGRRRTEDFDYDSLIPRRYKSDAALWARQPHIEPIDAEITKDTQGN